MFERKGEGVFTMLGNQQTLPRKDVAHRTVRPARSTHMRVYTHKRDKRTTVMQTTATCVSTSSTLRGYHEGT